MVVVVVGVSVVVTVGVADVVGGVFVGSGRGFIDFQDPQLSTSSTS